MAEIDGNTLDPHFKQDVAALPGGENITLCFSCGTCTASCPAAGIDADYNPRRIIRQVLLGQRDEVLSSPVIWRCVLCYACTATCPQNVKFRDVMRALRELAVREGKVRPGLNAEVAELDRYVQTLRRDMVDLLVSQPEKFAQFRDALNQARGSAG
ncbi:MAG: succinate dehydrogenase iron-sulfur subunit [Lentisphaerae bacterium ADurb.BinA184]|nr:MAG: succinate dehydrogenase iron-sulfur subunit [Lentisphaerae bacterium ADurb.BinA184]